MQAFHSFWSLPNRVRSGGQVMIPDFELCTAALSALSWRKHSGPVKMITDSAGAAYFRSLGLACLWDEVDASLEGMDSSIDPFLFWAAGKLYALRSMDCPCVMLDTDLIIWEKPSILEASSYDVIAAHPEELMPGVYPPVDTLLLKDDYHFPDTWDFSLKAANTAFLFIRDKTFCDYYTGNAIEVFSHLDLSNQNPVTAMCFAEQRVLPLCCKEKGQKLGYLFDLSEANQQTVATHTWGFKNVLRQDASVREAFILRCLTRVHKDFPEYYEVLKKAVGR